MSAQCEVTAKVAAHAPLSFFERWLSLWVFLCILAGIAAGQREEAIAARNPGGPCRGQVLATDLDRVLDVDHFQQQGGNALDLGARRGSHRLGASGLRLGLVALTALGGRLGRDAERPLRVRGEVAEVPGHRTGGEGALVGAMALVAPGTIVPPGALVMGQPARVVRDVREAERAWMRETVLNYANLATDYSRKGP